MVHHAYEVYLGIGIAVALIALKNTTQWDGDLTGLINIVVLFVGMRLGVTYLSKPEPKPDHATN